MTNQPAQSCQICGSELTDIDTWPGPFGKGVFVVGNCPECGPDSPAAIISPINAEPIPQITVGPEAA